MNAHSVTVAAAASLAAVVSCSALRPKVEPSRAPAPNRLLLDQIPTAACCTGEIRLQGSARLFEGSEAIVTQSASLEWDAGVGCVARLESVVPPTVDLRFSSVDIGKGTQMFRPHVTLETLAAHGESRRLWQDRSLAVTVVDDRGRPAKGVEVVVRGRGATGAPIVSAKTNARGEVKLKSMPACLAPMAELEVTVDVSESVAYGSSDAMRWPAEPASARLELDRRVYRRIVRYQTAVADDDGGGAMPDWAALTLVGETDAHGGLGIADGTVAGFRYGERVRIELIADPKTGHEVKPVVATVDVDGERIKPARDGTFEWTPLRAADPESKAPSEGEVIIRVRDACEPQVETIAIAAAVGCDGKPILPSAFDVQWPSRKRRTFDRLTGRNRQIAVDGTKLKLELRKDECDLKGPPSIAVSATDPTYDAPTLESKDGRIDLAARRRTPRAFLVIDMSSNIAPVIDALRPQIAQFFQPPDQTKVPFAGRKVAYSRLAQIHDDEVASGTVAEVELAKLHTWLAEALERFEPTGDPSNPATLLSRTVFADAFLAAARAGSLSHRVVLVAGDAKVFKPSSLQKKVGKLPSGIEVDIVVVGIGGCPQSGVGREPRISGGWRFRCLPPDDVGEAVGRAFNEVCQ